MKIAELVLDYVEVLVWPLVVVFLVWRLRTQLHDALLRMTRVETPAGAIDFAVDAREARREAESVSRLPDDRSEEPPRWSPRPTGPPPPAAAPRHQPTGSDPPSGGDEPDAPHGPSVPGRPTGLSEPAGHHGQWGLPQQYPPPRNRPATDPWADGRPTGDRPADGPMRRLGAATVASHHLRLAEAMEGAPAHPAASVLAAWAVVEETWAETVGGGLRLSMPWGQASRTLAERGANPQLAWSVRTLYELRIRVAHGRERVTARAAGDYVEGCAQVVQALERLGPP